MKSSDPLSPQEREEYEEDLITFCDRELDILGDIRGRDVLYAGGTSPLWIEGLAERIGKKGSLTTLDLGEEGLSASQNLFLEEELPTRASFVVGDVFAPPFERGSFDLVYSAGLFHELDVSEKPAEHALAALASTLRPGGRLATSDFVDDAAAAQIDEEAIEAEMERRDFGAKLYGIGNSKRLIELHGRALADVRSRVFRPFPIRHLDKLFLSGDEPPKMTPRLRARWKAILDRVRREGYTRPMTVYVEGGA